MSKILKGITESSFADQFMTTMKNKGINARLAGSPDQERERTEKELAQRAQAHANQPKPTLSPEEIEQLKAQLDQAKQGFDPSYEYSDDYTFWAQQSQKAQTIHSIEKQLRDAGVELNEVSMDTLAKYKKAAGADARAADKEGDFKRGDKRFSGIVRATKKEFEKATAPKNEGKFTVNAKTGAKLDPRTGEPLPTPVKAPAAPKKPKLTYDMVWRKVEDVVGQIFPDGDPYDWLIPWFKQYGIEDFKIGDILDRAAKKNGYKDVYDYYEKMKDLYGKDTMAEADKHSFIGRIQRHNELKRKVDSTWQDAADAERRGDKKGAARAFNKHVRYTNLERPGTWRDVKEQGEVEGAPELLKAEIPLVRHIEKELAQHGYEKGTPEYDQMFKHSIAMYRKFGNVDAIKQGVAEGYEETEETAVINMFEKLVKQGRDPIDMIAHKFGWGSYELDQLARNLGFKNSSEWARAATQGKGVTESDISGLLAASHLNRSFIITANLAEGGTKKFRVKAQSERVAVEKFKKHHSMAEIVDVKEETVKEDWQKVNKSDKTDGMSDKAVKAYRRENPGSKLKTAVTKDPSKIKKGSSDDKRRKSFCARMSGMKKAHASAKTKRDPDSPINKALRRWNCEESVEESLRTENPCWKGYEPVGTKKKNGKTVPNCVPVKEEVTGMNNPSAGYRTYEPRHVPNQDEIQKTSGIMKGIKKD